jgi:hypothetical protein
VEVTIRSRASFGHQDMDMRMEVDAGTKALDHSHHHRCRGNISVLSILWFTCFGSTLLCSAIYILNLVKSYYGFYRNVFYMWADYGTILNVVQSLKLLGIVFLIVLTIGTLVYVIGLLIVRGNSV